MLHKEKAVERKMQILHSRKYKRHLFQSKDLIKGGERLRARASNQTRNNTHEEKEIRTGATRQRQYNRNKDSKEAGGTKPY